MSPRALRTYWYSIRPSSVRVTPLGLRAKSRAWRAVSSCLTDWLTADWEMYRFFAASEMLPVSATSLKTR